MLLILPLDRKPNWRTPPVITIFLVLVNVLCYFLWQINEDQYLHEAHNYYFSSDLPEIELPRYRDYLADANPTAFPKYTDYVVNDEMSPANVHGMMELDGYFMRRLNNEEIISTEDSQYSLWRKQRDDYEALKNKVVSYQYSLVNIQPTLISLFTHMFLHGSIGHLLGNMFFLVLFGYVVEMALGKKIYLAAYIAGGLLSGLFYLAISPNDAHWGLGASGAISGLSGMYTVLFGMRKIKFFFWFLVYFDYVKAPAIILLPIWLGFELFKQIYFDAGINYLAHMGGLLGGALLAYLLKKYTNLVNIEFLDEEDKKHSFKQQFEAGTQALAAMDAGKAKRIFTELAEDYPDNIEVMQQLYNVVKVNPNSPEIHQCARKILALTDTDKHIIKLQHTTFIDYVTRVQPNVKLSPDLMLSLALRFAANDYLEDAEKLVLHLTTRATGFERNAEGLMALATHYRRAKNDKKAHNYFSMLQKLYPNSAEAHNARQAFNYQESGSKAEPPPKNAIKINESTQ